MDRDSPDPELTSASCMGSGILYDDLWQTAKRYILRGDEFYQHAGLTVVREFAWNFPLDEVAIVLEDYFARHAYYPTMAAKGTLQLAGVEALYVVGTALGFVGDDFEQRRTRILGVLGRVLDATRYTDYAEDAAIVRKAIAGVRSNSPNIKLWVNGEEVKGSLFAPALPVDESWPSPAEPKSPNGHSAPAAPTIIDVEANAEAIERKQAFEASVAELEREKRFMRLEGYYERIDQRFTDLYALTGLQAGRRQVGLGRWQIILTIVAIAISIVAIVISFWPQVATVFAR